MRHFCTYFDSHYLLRGLTLFRSLQAHAGEFVLWVLCCDQAAFEALQTLNIANLRAVRVEEIERFEPRLARAQTNRSRVEYLWTLSPVWPRFLLEKYPEIEELVYLDADQFFYSSLEPIFEEIGDAPLSIFSHRYNARLRHMEVDGIYNVGWVGFRRGATALACLEKWGEQCLDWCYARRENGKYGDQKYLDEWPQLYPGTRVVEYAGAGIAPWNWADCRFERAGETLLCDGVPLIFFHFHGLRILNSWLHDPFFTSDLYGEIRAHKRRWLFGPYLRALTQTAAWARARGCRIPFGYTPPRQYLQNYGAKFSFKRLLGRCFVVHPGLR